MSVTKRELICELDGLIAELRSLGVDESENDSCVHLRPSGGTVTIDRQLASQIADAIARATDALNAPQQQENTGHSPGVLSQRQREILSWVALGKSNPVIAIILGISPNTVDTHLRKIFERLDTSDRTVAAIRGIEAGLISPEGLKAA